MARINLLPWREELRERKNKEFLTLLIMSLLLGLAAAFAAWTYFNNALSDQRLANERIVAENTKLDAELAEISVLEKRREEMISRMRVIQDLQGKRPLPVRVWDDVAKAIPPAMYLTTLSRDGDLLTFTGKADNPNIVSSLIRNLNASKWMDDSKVSYIRQNTDAYQSGNPGLSTDGRTILPEDSYIDFVVTTQVVTTDAKDDAVDGTEAAAPQATAPAPQAAASAPQATAPAPQAAAPAPQATAPAPQATAPAPQATAPAPQAAAPAPQAAAPAPAPQAASTPNSTATGGE